MGCGMADVGSGDFGGRGAEMVRGTEIAVAGGLAAGCAACASRPFTALADSATSPPISRFAGTRVGRSTR